MKYKVLLGFGASIVILAAVFSSSLLMRFRKSTVPLRQSSPQSFTETLPESIRIKAVGDMVPGTNFPSSSLPSNPNQLFGQSVREMLQESDSIFGNFDPLGIKLLN